MAKKPSTEEALAAIHAIRQGPEQYDLARDLGPFLRHKSNHVVAAAAATAGRFEVSALAPDLVEAFERLMRDPSKLDPGCKATMEIVQALIGIDERAAKVYFAGVRHVQMEGSFGPPVDAAAPLRGLCAQGLARTGDPDALIECVTLLTDPWLPARVGAVRAIADAGRPEGVLLLRLKALTGDKEDEVTGECFSALLQLEPARSVEFVAGFLDQSEETREQAAMALGESRLAEAFKVLRERWERGGPRELRRILLVAIAMSRSEDSLAFLLDRLREESASVAGDVLAGLALYARDEAVVARVEEVVRNRSEPSLDATFTREFRLGSNVTG
jgi:HEAT repeat protein